jgi:hypothetical protein
MAILRAGPPGFIYATWAAFIVWEITMRWLTAALILLCGASAASADIRVDESRYESGKTIVTGETGPDRTLTLDGKYKTKSDGRGHFEFDVKYKPSDCMTDIKAGQDVYSAVIAGCFGVTSGAGAVTTTVKPHP